MGNNVFWARVLRSVPLVVLAAAGGSVLMSAAPRLPQAVAIEITARRFAFVPDRLEVIEGDLVALAVKSADGPHGIEIKKLKLKKAVPRGGSAVLLSAARNDCQETAGEECLVQAAAFAFLRHFLQREKDAGLV